MSESLFYGDDFAPEFLPVPSTSDEGCNSNCSSGRESPLPADNQDNGVIYSKISQTGRTATVTSSKRPSPNPPDAATSGSMQVPLPRRDTLPPSTTTSALANPPSEQRDSPFPTTEAGSMTPPASHTGVPENVGGAFERPHSRRLKCPFLEHVRDFPQSYPNHSALLAEAERIDALVSTDNIAEYERWKQIRTLPSTPPSIDSSNPPGGAEQVSYLCPGLLDDTHQQPTTSTTTTSGRYGCPLCGKRCTRRHDLRKHLQARNPAAKYYCRVRSCVKVYHRPDKYQEHVRRKHPNPHRTNDSLSNDAVPLAQAFPEQCLHCTEHMQSFEDWLLHWFGVHKADPNTPRRTLPGGMSDPLSRYVTAPGRLVGNLPTGANDYADLDQSTGKWFRDAQGASNQ